MLGIDSERQGRYGWLRKPEAVAQVMQSLPKPLFGSEGVGGELMRSLDETKEMLLYEPFRKLVGKDAPKGPQQIGDCTSWGWSAFINYTQIAQMLDTIAQIDPKLATQLLFMAKEAWDAELKDTIEGLTLGTIAAKKIVSDAALDGELMPLEDALSEAVPQIKGTKWEYQENCTEAFYALERCEVGGQNGSMEDGGVGAWCAKAATDYGTLSRKALEEAGLPGAYDPQRAKKWGAQGLPDNLEPTAKMHITKVVSMIKSFKEAAAAIQNLQPVPVCSDQGFTMTRDAQGFCRAQGIWYHCMCFIAVRWDRPGLLCNQNWGPNTPTGPVYKDQPDNTFWVDAAVCDKMLRQEDSYTGNTFAAYAKRNYVDWSH